MFASKERQTAAQVRSLVQLVVGALNQRVRFPALILIHFIHVDVEM